MLYFMRSFKPALARDYDVFFAAIGLLCGGILFFQGWRLDPILQFGQFLLAGTTVFFAYESVRLRGVSAEQARRSAYFDDEPAARAPLEACVATTTATTASMNPSRSGDVLRRRTLMRRKDRSRISIGRVATPEPPSLKRPPAAGEVAPMPHRTGVVIASRTVAWRDSAIETTSVHPRVPASATAAHREMINAAVAVPMQPHAPPPHRNFSHIRSAAGSRVSVPLQQAAEHQNQPGVPQGTPFRQPPKTRRTAPADGPTMPPHQQLLPRQPHPPLGAHRTQDGLLHAVRVRGTTVPASTTDPLRPAAAARGQLDGDRVQRPIATCPGIAPA